MEMIRKLRMFLMSVALVVLMGGWWRMGNPTFELTPAIELSFVENGEPPGPQSPPSQARENCNGIVNLFFPPGWSFTIFSVAHLGYARLDRMEAGTQRSAYFFEGGFPSAALESHLYGRGREDGAVGAK